MVALAEYFIQKCESHVWIAHHACAVSIETWAKMHLFAYLISIALSV